MHSTNNIFTACQNKLPPIEFSFQYLDPEKSLKTSYKILYWSWSDFPFISVFLYLFKDSGYEPLSTFDRSIMVVFHMSFGSFDVSI